MDTQEFKKWANAANEWIADYRDSLTQHPVRSNVTPGYYLEQLPTNPPSEPEDFAEIFDDFKKLVPPGLTNWQHPRFFAYFPANSSMPSVIAEQLTAGIAANCMLWQTSPVATEMEIRMLEWLGQLCNVPKTWQGVIQDSASSANFAAIVTAREIALNWQGNQEGLNKHKTLRFYYAQKSHSSINKGIKLAGIGLENAIAIPDDEYHSMDVTVLEEKINEDLKNGYIPAGVFAVVGATSNGYSDDLVKVGEIVNKYNLYGHVDAAWSGSATICDEYKDLIKGLELWDSYVFNPHKWMGVNFDLSAHFLKDPSKQIKTFSLVPDYLKTQHATNTVDFSNWTAPLGRRFRALKLWFVIRSFGKSGLVKMIKDHVTWAENAASQLSFAKDFKIVTNPQLAMFLFRHEPSGLTTDELNEHNQKLLNAINQDGYLYLTQTMHENKYTLRFVVGTTLTTKEDVNNSVNKIIEIAKSITNKQ